MKTKTAQMVIEWVDHNGAPQFRIMSKASAQTYYNYLLSEGLKVSIYAA